MKRNTFNKMILGLVGAGAGAFALYVTAVRPWHLRWGATDEEMNESLPGDEVKPDADISVTHAITIDAPPESVWKWLVQIGQGRGGFYSYDFLENLFGLQIHNADEIKPELQKIKEGDFIRSADPAWLGGKYRDVTGWYVVRLELNRILVLRDEIEKGSWAFLLKPIGENQTRLIIRARGNEPTSLAMRLFHFGVFEPAHFIMERKMMLILKERAEAGIAGLNSCGESRDDYPSFESREISEHV